MNNRVWDEEMLQPTAIDHLGNVLSMLAELHEDDQSDAYVEALAFYNNARPDAKVEPVAGYTTRLVHETPLDAWPDEPDNVRSQTNEGKYYDYGDLSEIDAAHWAGRDEKVKYLGTNGNDYDRKKCDTLGMLRGEILTVKTCNIGSWSSTYTFKEYPGEKFNTVMFEMVEDK
jgi:hypothetical protein